MLVRFSKLIVLTVLNRNKIQNQYYNQLSISLVYLNYFSQSWSQPERAADLSASTHTFTNWKMSFKPLRFTIEPSYNANLQNKQHVHQNQLFPTV